MVQLPEFERVNHLEGDEKKSSKKKCKMNDDSLCFLTVCACVIILAIACDCQCNRRTKEDMEKYTGQQVWDLMQAKLDINNDNEITQEECQASIHVPSYDVDWICSERIISCGSLHYGIVEKDIVDHTQCVFRCGGASGIFEVLGQLKDIDRSS